MLIQVILVGMLLIGIILLGVQLGVKIEELEVQVFFWILYGVSIVTLFMAILCGYIYYVFRKKTGPLGPQGFQGEPGEKGDPGTCDQNLCRGRTLAILMEKLIEKHNKTPVKSEIKNLICGYITISNPRVSGTKVSDTLKEWDLLDVKTYSNIFQKQLSQNDGLIDDEATLRTVINGAKNKFNAYASTSKQLPVMGDTGSNRCIL